MKVRTCSLWLAANRCLPADTFGLTVFGGGAGHEANEVDDLLASWGVVGQSAETLVAVTQDDHVGVVDHSVEVRVEQGRNVRDLRLDVVFVRAVDTGVFDVAV